jgi:hypothetical protein
MAARFDRKSGDLSQFFEFWPNLAADRENEMANFVRFCCHFSLLLNKP